MPYVEIIQVPTDLFGGIDDTVQIQIQTVHERREDFRQHRHLDRVGNLQLTLHAFVLRSRFDQLLIALSGVPDDKNQYSQTQQHQQSYNLTDPVQVSKHLILRNNNLDMPAGGINLFVKRVVLASRDRIDHPHDIATLA